MAETGQDADNDSNGGNGYSGGGAQYCDALFDRGFLFLASVYCKIKT